MVLHTRRKATPARNLFPFKVPTFLLRKCTVIGPFFPQIYIPDSKVKSALLPLFHIFDRFQQTCFIWELDPFVLMEPYVTMTDVTATNTAASIVTPGPNYTACSPLLPKLLGHHLVKLQKMFFGKVWRALSSVDNHSQKKNQRCFLCSIFDRFQQTQKMFFWELDPFALTSRWLMWLQLSKDSCK